MSLRLAFIDESRLNSVMYNPPSAEMSNYTLRAAVRDFFATHNTDHGHVRLHLSSEKTLRMEARIEPCKADDFREIAYKPEMRELPSNWLPSWGPQPEESKRFKQIGLSIDFKIDRDQMTEDQDALSLVDASMRTMAPNRMVCYFYNCNVFA